LLPQNVAKQFESETMMSISTFSGVDLEDGNYLKVLSPPVNVIQNSEALRDIIQFDVSASVTNATTRDPGAAIRDAVSFSSQFNSGAGNILYLVSRRYVDAGPTVKELDMIDTLWLSSVTLICVEGGNVNDPNRLFNLKRVTELTEGYYFTNTDTQTNSWPNTNDAAVNQMLNLARSPIDLVGRKVSIPLITQICKLKATKLVFNIDSKILRLTEQNILEFRILFILAVYFSTPNLVPIQLSPFKAHRKAQSQWILPMFKPE